MKTSNKKFLEFIIFLVFLLYSHLSSYEIEENFIPLTNQNILTSVSQNSYKLKPDELIFPPSSSTPPKLQIETKEKETLPTDLKIKTSKPSLIEKKTIKDSEKDKKSVEEPSSKKTEMKDEKSEVRQPIIEEEKTLKVKTKPEVGKEKTFPKKKYVKNKFFTLASYFAPKENYLENSFQGGIAYERELYKGDNLNLCISYTQLRDDNFLIYPERMEFKISKVYLTYNFKFAEIKNRRFYHGFGPAFIYAKQNYLRYDILSNLYLTYKASESKIGLTTFLGYEKSDDVLLRIRYDFLKVNEVQLGGFMLEVGYNMNL